MNEKFKIAFKYAVKNMELNTHMYLSGGIFLVFLG